MPFASSLDFDISYTLPSQCAANLREGSADIGIIPAAAYASIPELAILPGSSHRFAAGGSLHPAGQQGSAGKNSGRSHWILRP